MFQQMRWLPCIVPHGNHENHVDDLLRVIYSFMLLTFPISMKEMDAIKSQSIIAEPAQSAYWETGLVTWKEPRD